MNTRHSLSSVLIACAIVPLLLGACQPVNLPSPQPTAAIPATSTPAPSSSGDISLNLAGLAQSQIIETVPAVPASPDHPWWESLPEYRRITLEGYPVSDHLMKAQIFVFPASELAAFNETAGQTAVELKTVLDLQHPAAQMPFLPPFNAAQMLRAQVRFFDFQNGKGVRYLTQYAQGILPVNSYELIYTYQGLTRDGKYYLAAVLPVTHPDLPATQQVYASSEQELKDFPAYLQKTATMLDEQPGNRFTPDLARLDAMIQSIEIHE